MSALHRLKAYFGMVPVEEFDAAQFGAAEFDDYHASYRTEHPDPGNGNQGYDPAYDAGTDRVAVETSAANGPSEHAAERPGVRRPHQAAVDDYDDGFATRVGHHAVTRAHSSRSPSWAAGSRSTDSRAVGPWMAAAPVRGSLAIDTATIDARSTVRQPVAPQRVTPAPRTASLAEDALGDGGSHPLSRIVTLHPHNYNEARPIGERYREGNPVIMNLTEMEDRDAKRLVDFAAGLAFALRGSIDKVTNKVFLLSPPNVDVSAEDRRRIAEGRFFS
ncbi:MAG: cell division protein SepF [Pseudonocardiaceae bacterium]